MRLQKLIMPAALVVLAVLSSTVSSSLLGLHGRKGHATAGMTVAQTGSESVYAGKPRPPRPGGIVDHPLAVFKLNRCDVGLVDGRVGVSAEVSITDRRLGMVYLWGLRVDDRETEENVANRLYDDQVFFLNGERPTTHPTFDEAIDLPPGDYRVVLKLFAVPIEFPFGELLEKSKADSRDAISYTQRITVPG